jgi:CheY-like chemotaxis protein
MLIVAGICSAQLAETDPEQQKHSQPDFYQQDKNQRIAQDEQEKFRLRVSIENAVGEDVPLAFPKRLPANEKAIAAKQRSDSEEMILQGIILVILCFPTGILAFRILAPALFKAFVKKLSPWSGAPQTVTSLDARVREEDEAFSKFIPSFQSGPLASPSNNAGHCNVQQNAGDVTTEFCNRAARILAPQRLLLHEISRTLDNSVRQRMLADLGRELASFKGEAASPEFLPAWQMTSALEGLLKQLAGKSGNVTSSTLRTVTGAVDLLQELCKPGVRRDMLSNPPLRFLAVDDDVISRTAVSLALRKAFNGADLGENGEAALSMAAKHAVWMDLNFAQEFTRARSTRTRP